MLIAFKVMKKDIDDEYDFFWRGIFLGLVSTFAFIIYGIGYLLVTIPYKLLFGKRCNNGK